MRRLPIFFAIPIAALLLGVPSGSIADPIDPGFDLLNSKKGKITVKSLPGVSLPAPLKVQLKGIPFKKNPFFESDPRIGPKGPKFGNTNKILKRKGRVLGNGSTSIKLKALSKKSTESITLKKQGTTGEYKMFVTLDKKKTQPKGKLKIGDHDPAVNIGNGGGTFALTIPGIFLQVDLLPIGGNTANPIRGLITAGETTGAGTWGHEEGYPTIPNLPAGFFTFNGFDVSDTVIQLSGIIPAAVIPEPVTLVLLGTGLVLVGLGRRRHVAA